jgi:hypothetical protein
VQAKRADGWTGCVAKIMQTFASVSAEDFLREGNRAGRVCREAPK